MKLIHVISLLLMVIGGLHFALGGLGVNFIGMIFGDANVTILHILIGLSILHHVLPGLKSQLASL